MKVAGQFHLTYCSNIHAGETWDEVSAALADTLPRVRAALGFAGPFAIGLRLSAQAAEALEAPAALHAFMAFLERGDYYVLTINGFPYGAFHGQRVKERVYLPDWRDPARLDYTNRLARLMAAFLATGPRIEGSVSTVPGAFRTDVATEQDAAAIAGAILEHAAFLVELRRTSGRTVMLAIEPEPACFLETIDDVLPFFNERLFNEAAVAAAARRANLALTTDDVRRHVGICLDACHMAVEFEDPEDVLQRLTRAGIRIAKVQLSAALRFEQDEGARDPRAAFAPFADEVYLHQVVQRRDAELVRFVDLPQALAAPPPSARPAEWRVHFHVPLFLSEMQDFRTTQPELARLLRLLRDGGECPYLEVETYTWDVLPPQYRNVPVSAAIARELDWVRTTLTS